MGRVETLQALWRFRARSSVPSPNVQRQPNAKAADLVGCPVDLSVNEEEGLLGVFSAVATWGAGGAESIVLELEQTACDKYCLKMLLLVINISQQN